MKLADAIDVLESLHDQGESYESIINDLLNRKKFASLPIWLDSEIWQDFKTHRGKKFTVRAQELAIEKLNVFRLKGHDPAIILKESIANGWKGIFEPKGAGYANQRDTERAETYAGLTGKSPRTTERTIEGTSSRVD